MGLPLISIWARNITTRPPSWLITHGMPPNAVPATIARCTGPGGTAAWCWIPPQGPASHPTFPRPTSATPDPAATAQIWAPYRVMGTALRTMLGLSLWWSQRINLNHLDKSIIWINQLNQSIESINWINQLNQSIESINHLNQSIIWNNQLNQAIIWINQSSETINRLDQSIIWINQSSLTSKNFFLRNLSVQLNLSGM